MELRLSKLGKIVVAVAFFLYFVGYINDPLNNFLMNNINLVFHEAGHTLAIFLGQFIYVLAGSVFQVMVPLFLVGYFAWYRLELFSGSLLMYWLGSAIVSVGIYAADGKLRALPLITGDPDTHDWFYLFSTAGLLDHAEGIGFAIKAFGILVIFAAAVASFYFAAKEGEAV